MSWGVQRPRTKAQRLHWESVLTGARGRLARSCGRSRRSAPVSLAPVEFGRGYRDGDAAASIDVVANVRGKTQ